MVAVDGHGGLLQGACRMRWTALHACSAFHIQEFVCVENAAVGKPITVAPGSSWSGSMELSV